MECDFDGVGHGAPLPSLRDHGEVFRDDPDLSFHRHRVFQAVKAEQRHGSGGRREKSGEALDRGRLAGTVDAVHRDESSELSTQLVRMNGEVHARILPGGPL